MAASIFDLPSIDTERLHIRRLRASDAEAFALMTNEPALLEAVHFLGHPLTAADAEKLIAGDGRGCFWGVWESGQPDLAGTVGTHVHDVEIEIGYWFATSVQGRGLASGAVRAVTAVLSETFPDYAVVAECRPENVASRRLLERNGFRPDGAAGLRPGRRRFVFTR